MPASLLTTFRLLGSAAIASALMVTTALADIQTRTVTFENEGATMAGTLYLPDGYRTGDKLPVAIVTGAWTSVEEQMPATYAREMADRGLAAFTFDFRGWGKSGDLPKGEGGTRYIEDPAAKTDDIEAAIAFVATLPEVDANAIHGLGICASAGYMIDATSGNPLVQRVGLVAPWLQNRELVEVVYGGVEGVKGLEETARRAEAKGGEIIPAAGPEGAEGVLMPLGGYYHEPDRGAVPAYDNKWNQASWDDWLNYHPADSASSFDKPLAIVHSEAAAIPDGVRTFLASFSGDAKQQWLEDVDQFSFYDRPDAVETASDTMADHFKAGAM